MLYVCTFNGYKMVLHSDDRNLSVFYQVQPKGRLHVVPYDAKKRAFVARFSDNRDRAVLYVTVGGHTREIYNCRLTKMEIEIAELFQEINRCSNLLR